MKIIDRVSQTFGLSEKEEEKESEIATKEEVQAPQPEQKESPIQPPPKNVTGHNVVDFNSAIAAKENFMTDNNITKPMAKSKITTIRPKTFDEDAKIVADCLRENIPVIINLEETNPGHAQRIIDFALGTTYALDGEFQSISEKVFVCTPKTVMITFNKEEAKQEKDFSWLTRKF